MVRTWAKAVVEKPGRTGLRPLEKMVAAVHATIVPRLGLQALGEPPERARSPPASNPIAALLRHGTGFGFVVGNPQGGHALLGNALAEFVRAVAGASRHRARRRAIQQQHAWAGNERAGQRALLLAADRCVMRLRTCAPSPRRSTTQACARAPGLSRPAPQRPKATLSLHVEMRKQGKVLEQQGAMPTLGGTYRIASLQPDAARPAAPARR